MAKNDKAMSSFVLLLTAIFSTPAVAADAINAACIDIVDGAIDTIHCSDGGSREGYSKPADSLNTAGSGADSDPS